MAELCVRIIDRPGSDRGDVISVLEDGAHWGSNVLSSNRHRIIKIPGVAVAEFDYLTMPEVPQELGQESTFRRGVKLDLDVLGITSESRTVKQVVPVREKLSVQVVEVETEDGGKEQRSLVEWSEVRQKEIDAFVPIEGLTLKQVQAASIVKERK